MSENMLGGLNPVTQTIEGGKALAKFLGLSEELPETIALANGARLTLSSKKDCYYFTNAKVCTCKAGTYGRICRHRMALGSRPQSMAETLEDHDRNLHKMSKSYQRMVRMVREEAEAEPMIHKGGFRPCLPEEA
jgi:hypothetical protein